MPIAQHGGYLVAADPVAVARPNRLAAGMTKTFERRRKVLANQLRGDKLSDEVTRLLVKGTCDTLFGLWFVTTKKPCPCCGGKSNKLSLNERGRARLARLRRKCAEDQPERRRLT